MAISPTALRTQVALVTGASRGVGRGIATALHEAGATVFVTGRTIAHAALPPGIVRVPCDHRDDTAVASAFARVRDEVGRLDILVNSVWGGYEHMVEDGRFSWSDPLWLQPAWRWDAMMGAGVRATFVACQEAARLMIPARHGLLVTISFWAAQAYVGNALYGAAKAASDKLTADLARELKPHAVAALTLYPGLVRTEAVLAAAGAFDLSNSESPEFQGRAIAALAADPRVLDRTGQILVTAALAAEYGFTDVDGARPRPLARRDL